MKKRAPLAVAMFASFGVGILALLTRAPAQGQARLDELIAKIETQDPSLDSYQASIDFTMGLRSLPFFRRSVHGTAYYKRPDRLELVMEKLPSYAHDLEHIFVGLGPPQAWSEKFTVAIADEGGKNEHIQLTPKEPGSRVRYVEIHLDQASGLPAKLVWDYTNGHIEMTQKIEKIAGHYVGTAQEAEMRYPMVHAYMRTKVHDFIWNAPVDDAIFTPSVMLNP